MAAAPHTTTPVPTTPTRPPPRESLLLPPPQVPSPSRFPTPRSTSKPSLPDLQFRASTLSRLSADFFAYLDKVKLSRSQGHVPTESEAARFELNLVKGDRLAKNYWALIRDLTIAIRGIYLPANQDPEATLVLAYSSAKIVVQCPYCDEYHEHRRVTATIGVPVIYPAGCGAFGRYSVVFPGDVHKLAGELGDATVGVEVHSSGAYWVAVQEDMPDLESFFVVKYRPRPPVAQSKGVPISTKKVEAAPAEGNGKAIKQKEEAGAKEAEEQAEEKIMFEAFHKLNIAEHWSYDPVAVMPKGQWGTIKKLQETAKTCVQSLNTLTSILGHLTPPAHKVVAKRWKEATVQRETRSKAVREMDYQLCTISYGTASRTLGLVESDGFRTVCSCVRGPKYLDVSVVSGLVESERLEPLLPANNKQLRLLVQSLAKEIGHVFPEEIPKGAVHWKRELEKNRRTASSAEHWYACHAEKKMLVRYLMMHTTWTPEGFSHTFFKNRNLLGKEAGARTSISLAKDVQFWVSYDICEDCDRFIAGVCRKFGVKLSFNTMEKENVSRKPDSAQKDEDEEATPDRQAGESDDGVSKD
ncbi:hypothetical protein DRE_03539 [Drechslerella stenobrocha 248]|uniref:Uncharacterized protein n=1 Tax=Drechslerella stenobrocha 248 TaxID=1043628 RepID=W7IDV6_9PEZI|nr:hypothetical protein DRE_03539 [Drechslerella stenobrocha 248]